MLLEVIKDHSFHFSLLFSFFLPEPRCWTVRILPPAPSRSPSPALAGLKQNADNTRNLAACCSCLRYGNLLTVMFLVVFWGKWSQTAVGSRYNLTQPCVQIFTFYLESFPQKCAVTKRFSNSPLDVLLPHYTVCSTGTKPNQKLWQTVSVQQWSQRGTRLSVWSSSHFWQALVIKKYQTKETGRRVEKWVAKGRLLHGEYEGWKQQLY